MKFKRPAAERFWSEVVKRESGCWLFRDRPNEYARFVGDDGKRILAHRFSYNLHHGEIPHGFYVCHKCDVRGCVNPDHLYAGTFVENNQDIVDRKRHNANVTDEEKQEWRRRDKSGKLVKIPSTATREDIKSLYATGNYTQTKLAEHFGLTQGTVSAIIRGARNYGNGGVPKKRDTSNMGRFTKEQLVEMVRLYEAGMTQVEIAERFGCTQAHVSRTVLKHRS